MMLSSSCLDRMPVSYSELTLHVLTKYHQFCLLFGLLLSTPTPTSQHPPPLPYLCGLPCLAVYYGDIVAWPC